MSDFKSAAVFNTIKTYIAAKPSEAQSKAKGIFEIHIKLNDEERVWTLDLKEQPGVQDGKGSAKPDIILTLSDDTFVDLSNGKINGQKAFMSGKLKIKGNMMLATKLDQILKASKTNAKL